MIEDMNTEKEVRARIAELIRQQYRPRGMKRSDFANELGISERMIGYWTDGTSAVSLDLRPRIEEMFGWPLGAITQAMLEGMSGKALDQIQIGQADDKPLDSADELVNSQADDKPLEKVPASDLADELVNRLRTAEDEVVSLRRKLEDAQRLLRKVQRDGTRP
jgi:predicted transcriptional regulator